MSNGFDFGAPQPFVDINNLEAEITRWRNTAFANASRAEAATQLLKERDTEITRLQNSIRNLRVERDELARQIRLLPPEGA